MFYTILTEKQTNLMNLIILNRLKKTIINIDMFYENIKCHQLVSE